jgi:trigger factor
VFELKKEILGSHEAILTLDIDKKTERRAIQKVTGQISREVNFPGFRKGKAPLGVILRRYGEENVLRALAKYLLEGDFYAKAIEEAGIEPYGPGQIEDISLSPMQLTFRVPLMPEVELGDYESLRMDPEPVEVTEEDLMSVLKNIQAEHAILEPVDRASEEGDALLLSLFEGEVDGDLIVQEHDLEVILNPEEEIIAPGVVEELYGLSNDDEKSFMVTLPEDFDEGRLAGEEVQFFVDVDQVYERELPGIDDALASTVGHFETLDELKDELRQQIRQHKERTAKEDYHDALVDALIADAELHYPPLMVEKQLDDMIEDIQANVERSHDLEWEDYLNQQRITEEKLREDLRSRAVERIERGLILAEFAKATGVEVSDAEVRIEMEDTLHQMGVDDPNLLSAFKVDSEAGQDTRARLMGRKTLQRLEHLAQGLPMEEPESEEETKSEVDLAAETESSPEAESETDITEIDTDAVKSGVDATEADTDTT